MSVNVVSPTAFPLYSGGYFDYMDPSPEYMDILDVARALSHICRFNGHCEWHYSVAQHSVHCCDSVSKGNAYAALMHDAPEFVMQDIIRPLKGALPDYKRIDDAVSRVVYDKFRVPYPLPNEVHEVDHAMLATEQQQLCPRAAKDRWIYTHGKSPLPLVIPRWTPEQAALEFMRRFNLYCTQ